MLRKAILLVILFCICPGCTSEQWVKEYVKGETAGLQEALNRHTADWGRRQEELEKKQEVLEGQITEMRASLEALSRQADDLEKGRVALEGQLAEMHASLGALNVSTAEAGRGREEPEKKQPQTEGQIAEMRVPLETVDRYPKRVEILNLRSEIEKKFAELEEMKQGLSRLEELRQIDYTAWGKALSGLETSVNDAKRFVDMNVTEVFKAQSLLKNFIIEEVRTLRQEHQDYARELKGIKSRLQTIESATEKKNHPEM